MGYLLDFLSDLNARNSMSKLNKDNRKTVYKLPVDGCCVGFGLGFSVGELDGCKVGFAVGYLEKRNTKVFTQRLMTTNLRLDWCLVFVRDLRLVQLNLILRNRQPLHKCSVNTTLRWSLGWSVRWTFGWS